MHALVSHARNAPDSNSLMIQRMRERMRLTTCDTDEEATRPVDAAKTDGLNGNTESGDSASTEASPIISSELQAAISKGGNQTRSQGVSQERVDCHQTEQDDEDDEETTTTPKIEAPEQVEQRSTEQSVAATFQGSGTNIERSAIVAYDRKPHDRLHAHPHENTQSSNGKTGADARAASTSATAPAGAMGSSETTRANSAYSTSKKFEIFPLERQESLRRWYAAKDEDEDDDELDPPREPEFPKSALQKEDTPKDKSIGANTILPRSDVYHALNQEIVPQAVTPSAAEPVLRIEHDEKTQQLSHSEANGVFKESEQSPLGTSMNADVHIRTTKDDHDPNAAASEAPEGLSSTRSVSGLDHEQAPQSHDDSVVEINALEAEVSDKSSEPDTAAKHSIPDTNKPVSGTKRSVDPLSEQSVSKRPRSEVIDLTEDDGDVVMVKQEVLSRTSAVVQVPPPPAGDEETDLQAELEDILLKRQDLVLADRQAAVERRLRALQKKAVDKAQG